MACQLLFLNGQRQGSALRFDQPAFWIGRDPHCELALDPEGDRAASGRHAQIALVGSSYQLRDQSSNGTFVNGQRVKEATLKEGDLLELGQGGPQFRFTLLSEAILPTLFHQAAADPQGAAPPGAPAPAAPSPVPHVAPRPAASAPAAPLPAPRVAPGPAPRPAGPPRAVSRSAAGGSGVLIVGLRGLGSLFLVAAVACLALALVKGGAAKGDKAGSGELTTKMIAKEKLITGAYKVYGLSDGEVVLWLAKTVFKNETDGLVKDLRVRYRLGEYADWCSWQTYPQLVPTQTVVDLYHPILSSSIAKLTSRTPAELQMEAEWLDSKGEKKRLEKSERISLLSSQEFFFTDLRTEERTGSFQDFAANAYLLASYVTSQDTAVSGLASMANERAKGAGAATSDNACIAVMSELYEIMRIIRITYQSPAHQVEQDKSFDTTLMQTLQYPRDTIRKRTGTCIDLALLYASMMNAVGIKPVLVMLDGHAFPLGITPGGGMVPVETTGVGGGGKDSINFAQAVQVGQKEFKQIQETGRYVLVNLQKAWGAGITPPELPPLPADILDRWKITDQVRGAGTPQVASGADPGGAGGTPGQASGGQLVAGDYAFVARASGGTFRGSARVSVSGNQVQILFALTYQGKGQDGRVHKGTEQNLFVGTTGGGAVKATCSQAAWTLDGRKIQPQGLPFHLQLAVGDGGRSASGMVVGSTGTQVRVTMKMR
jgi:pSer/pThr/pTyr-binding forkhead associated (FHA) protein